MVQMLDHARQIAYSVTVGIGEGTRVDLVEHGVLPPRHAGFDVCHARAAEAVTRREGGASTAGPGSSTRPQAADLRPGACTGCSEES